MKILMLIAALVLLGVYGLHRYTHRKYPQDNAGRRSGQDRRKTFDARKNRMRRSDIDRRDQSDRRRLLRIK